MNAKNLIFLAVISALGLFLRLYLLSSTMPFIGDQAWFYLSARDALLTGNFPLLGITASVTWLHQGPLWTYLLIPGLAVSRFHPVSGAVFTGLLSSLTIILCYFLGRIWFGSRPGLTAAFIFAASPLVVIHARMPYHTSLIPFFLASFLLLLYRRRYFWSFLLLGFLYQLELATVVFWPLMVFFLIRRRYQPRFRDLSAFVLGILPFILAGPVQTGGVFLWTIYHFLTHAGSGLSPGAFYLGLLQRFYLPGVPHVSWLLLIFTLIYVTFHKRWEVLWLVLPLAVIFVNGTPSEAYFTLLLVPISLFSGYFLSALFPRYSLFVFFSAWWLINSHYLLSQNFLIDAGSYGVAFSSRLALSDQILHQSITSTPSLTATGPGSQFATTIDPYRYLVWWRGLTTPPSGSHLVFQVNDALQTLRVIQ